MRNIEKFVIKPSGKIEFHALRSVGADFAYPCQHIYGRNPHAFPANVPQADNHAEESVWAVFCRCAAQAGVIRLVIG